jgi:hypothetical protein
MLEDNHCLLQFSMLLLEVGNNNRHDDALEKPQEKSRDILLIHVMEFSSFSIRVYQFEWSGRLLCTYLQSIIIES